MHRTDNSDYPERDNPAACEPIEGHDEAKCKVLLIHLTDLFVACYLDLCMFVSKPSREAVSMDIRNVRKILFFHAQNVLQVIVGTILFSCTMQTGNIIPHQALNNGSAVYKLLAHLVVSHLLWGLVTIRIKKVEHNADTKVSHCLRQEC